LIPLDGFVFHASVVILNTLKANKLLAIREVPALHWRVRQEKLQNDCPEEGKSSQYQKKESPRGQSRVRLANAVTDKTRKHRR
jgi:hypothetical protein